MNRELKKVKKWLDANKLAFKIDKTKFVIFHSPGRKMTEPNIIWFDRKKILREKCVKFLGILSDANLNWRHHISELSKKLSRIISIFHEVRKFVPVDVLKILCYSLFYSLISYGITVWGFTYKSYIQELAVIQKTIVRVMTFKKQTQHSDPIFSQLEFLKL